MARVKTAAQMQRLVAHPGNTVPWWRRWSQHGVLALAGVAASEAFDKQRSRLLSLNADAASQS